MADAEGCLNWWLIVPRVRANVTTRRKRRTMPSKKKAYKCKSFCGKEFTNEAGLMLHYCDIALQ
jgi:hypothetical protein